MRQIFNPALKSSIPAILVFLLTNAVAEQLCLKITGISIEHIFSERFQTDFGFLFQAVNLLLFSTEIFLVMFCYGFVRMVVKLKYKAIFYTVLFFKTFTGLFLGQLVNLKIYPVPAALVFGFVTLIALPVSVLTGANVYEKINSYEKETVHK